MSGGDSKGFPTVAGFKLIQRLGGGGFASVYKAMDKSGVVAACKVIAMNRKTPEKEKKVVTKEIQVHSTLVHDNIIRLKDALIVPDDGQTKYTPGAYLLMEMAHGGDLFDKIAPDIGVEDELAHYYMEQLMAGLVRYIFSYAPI
ncbi:Chk1 protein kinase [Serendipita sp. 397]|nr:Chk1 protein kinase [Serendipita sp. 397]